MAPGIRGRRSNAVDTRAQFKWSQTLSSDPVMFKEYLGFYGMKGFITRLIDTDFHGTYGSSFFFRYSF